MERGGTGPWKHWLAQFLAMSILGRGSGSPAQMTRQRTAAVLSPFKIHFS